MALAAVLASGERGLFVPQLAQAPGLTLDEGFNVAAGVYLVDALEAQGIGSLHPAAIREVYGSRNYNPDHPPLGRWALGFMHEYLKGNADSPFVETAARPASAIAFALTVFIAGWFLQKWFGPLAGNAAAFAVAILPRQFAHAHLASLETFIGLAYAACVFVTADRCTLKSAPPGWRSFVLPGVLFGLALLTKMQAVFLGPAVGVWALTQWKLKAVPRVALFGAVGLAVFFIGWPWLWLDPLAHVKEYFARTTERQTLYCFYWGERWADADVPWHYPWVMFAVTVPIGLHLLATLGLWRSRSLQFQAPVEFPPSPTVADTPHTTRSWGIDPRVQLILWAIVVPLAVFTKPGIRVYDGERLFGVVFPLWGALAGLGAAILLRRFPGRTTAGLLTVGLAAQAWGIPALNPFQLSYYNALTGGLAGADRLGFERSYWMEGLTDSFQREIVAKIPRGSRIDVAPVLHPIYLPHLLRQSPILQAAGISLAPYDDKRPDGSPYVLLFQRRADPWTSLDPPPAGTTILDEVKRSGVPLVTLLKLP
ncbi:Dolichyl-phosphate-mannose-protein mannosyltransferase [Caulifigura coniformis]|uniref:Dolichyl-phosphate-mannose-protein mannosyltransferase n=1 Tax=Caulifigura coniformis TaxID=2527983 RepID=A0A517SCC4_9PLAN|nr:glycosyltransferase family 39 protein [Caulifigura coniformis]QDT53790.1 Dolichyl-phosphate-mannose-protein mannosyltransferase [Caulifigura coniformis]